MHVAAYRKCPLVISDFNRIRYESRKCTKYN